jgi:hypothetical protein
MNDSLNRVLLVTIQHTIDACNQWRYVNQNVQPFHKQSALAWFQFISSVLMQITLQYRQLLNTNTCTIHGYTTRSSATGLGTHFALYSF